MKRLAIILLVAVSLLALLVVGCGGNSPSDSLRGFFKACCDGDYSKAKSYLTSQALEDFTPIMLSVAVEVCEREGGIKRIDIIEEEIRGDSAQIRWEIEFESGYSEEDGTYLIKENGKWKFTSFD